MKTIARLAAAASLVTAAVLGLAPGLAAADDRDGRWEQDRAPGQVWTDGRHHDRGFDDRFDDGRLDRFDHRGPARHRGWDSARFERVRALRSELRRLDDDRADFHARFAWRPRKLARYDAWYFAQRAELERALQRLSRYAWR